MLFLLRGLAVHWMVVGAVAGCSAQAPDPASRAADSPAPTASVTVPAVASEEPQPVAAATLVPLSPDDVSRLEALVAGFQQGRICDVEGLSELRALREHHGPSPALVGALRLAFKACDEPEATALLLAEILPAAPSEVQTLELGAAWLRASRYEEAVDVLLPLARARGPASKAAWLAGFALFHAGQTDEALPWLVGARTQVGAGNLSDAPLLIGLARLHAGEIDAAIVELEAGRARVPDNASILAALARAYTAAGRREDAERVSAEARVANDAQASRERANLRLSALSVQLDRARRAGNDAEVERILDEMLPLAPDAGRKPLLTLRIALYEKSGRSEDAASARAELSALAGAGSP